MEAAAFVGGGGGEGGLETGPPPGNVLKNTLNNTFWRHIYTELRNHGFSLVITSRNYVYQYLKKITKECGGGCFCGGGGKGVRKHPPWIFLEKYTK